MTHTPALFQPIQLGPLSLKNRIVMAPMTRTYSPGNVPNDMVVNYYQRRAENEVGLIITEGTCVGHKAANGYPRVPFIYGEEALAGWKKVVDAVHAKGGKIAPQLWHVGAIRKEGVEPDASVPGYSPSGLVKPGKENGVAMTQDDINEVIEAFAQAAADAKTIGFDAVEVHGAHGYLIDQFFWAVPTSVKTSTAVIWWPVPALPAKLLPPFASGSATTTPLSSASHSGNSKTMKHA